MRRDVEVYFYRTRSGMEVALLLETQHGIIGVEIKARRSVAPPDWRALREISGRLGGDWVGGLVIYRGSQIREVSDPGIWAIPSRRLVT